jgi:tRNA U54 and U55 pseudouridine synthase Pus10
LITNNSIEQQIATGLLVKQSLFESVLNNGSTTDYVDFSSKGRSQFIAQLEAFVGSAKDHSDTDDAATDTSDETEAAEQDSDFLEDSELVNSGHEDADKLSLAEEEVFVKRKSSPEERELKASELEQVMTSGMQFLSGLLKMSTGKDMKLETQQIKVNRDTGEVIMTFKLPL